jgi:hypothetical protein
MNGIFHQDTVKEMKNIIVTLTLMLFVVSSWATLVPASPLLKSEESGSAISVVESKVKKQSTVVVPTASITITTYPITITVGETFEVKVDFTMNFNQTGHGGRIYLEIIDAVSSNVITQLYKDNNGTGYKGPNGSVTFTTSLSSIYDSVYFRAYVAPMEMNSWMIDKYLWYPRDGSYPYLWSGNGVTHDIFYKGSLILSDNTSGNGCYCCAITYEVFMDAFENYNTTYGFDSIAGMSVSTMKDFRRTWYIVYGGVGDKGSVRALVDYNVGYEITNREEVLDGDFCQIWRHSGSGHSVIFHEWVRDAEDAIIGFTYWSTQSSTNGINFNTEYFGETTGMDPGQTYFGRAVKPPDSDDWINRYCNDDTSTTPSSVIAGSPQSWLFF